MNPLRYLSFLIFVLPLLASFARAAVVNATWNTASDVPVTAASYTATGNTVNFTLNHAPATGAFLTVVKNTGLPFIQGTFGNLTQGQAVALVHAGITYNFVANYFGGTGNDLILQWANALPTAWGYNSIGQLGNNSTTNSYVPIAVSASGVLSGKTVIAIAGGTFHSLALCSDGTVASWGYGGYGQLGNNSTASSLVPVAVTATGVLSGKTVIAIAGGLNHSLNHSLALCSDGTLAAWGENGQGQLGNNSTTQSLVPVAVTSSGVLSGKTVIAIAGGGSHSLALCSEGTVAAWGYNDYGQPGNNSTANSSVPVTSYGVLSGKTVIAIAEGNSHSLAIVANPLWPAASTTSATMIAGDGAILNGTVNASSNSTTVHFEYGLTTAYDTSVAANPLTITGNADTSVSTSITGLSAGTVYHYRVRATNAYGTTVGTDMTFAISTNANLSALALGTGTLSPVFASGITDYTARVSNATTTITVRPTLADTTASVRVQRHSRQFRGL